jgi:hypothetical protein
MLAMLDARIDASSTQGLALAGRLSAKAVDWMTPSSHGLVLAEDIATPRMRRPASYLLPLNRFKVNELLFYRSPKCSIS